MGDQPRERLTVVIAGIPDGPNKLVRLHWGALAKHRKRWRGDAFLAAVDARNRSGIRGFPWARARVVYEFGVPTRAPRDPDNLVAACKPLLDGIRDARIIADDSSGNVELGSPVVNHTPRLSSVRIHIERLDEGLAPPTA